MRYIILKTKNNNTWLIRDDGYRFAGMWLDGPCINCSGEWVHIMEYKQCDIMELSSAFADHIMQGSTEPK